MVLSCTESSVGNSYMTFRIKILCPEQALPSKQILLQNYVLTKLLYVFNPNVLEIINAINDYFLNIN